VDNTEGQDKSSAQDEPSAQDEQLPYDPLQLYAFRPEKGDIAEALASSAPLTPEQRYKLELEIRLRQLQVEMARSDSSAVTDQNQMSIERDVLIQESTAAITQSRTRILYGLIAVLARLVVLALLYGVSLFFFSSQGNNPEQMSNGVVASMGAVTSVIGSLVSAYFGIQLGSAGRERAESQRDRALASRSEQSTPRG